MTIAPAFRPVAFDAVSKTGTGALFLASTPLHSFWSIGLAAGPFSTQHNALALIDQRPGDVDYVVEAAQQTGFAHLSDHRRFERIGKGVVQKLTSARARMRDVQAYSAALRPDWVLVGNDRRAEFHAALRGSPSARGAYLDDGLFSYLPMPLGPQPPWKRWAVRQARRLAYGLHAEHPTHVGGSQAVQHAWVMLPYQVHAGLTEKSVHRLDPTWFRLPAARAVYAAAMTLAGIGPEQIRALRLLVLLPHDAFLREHPELLETLRGAVREHRASGHAVGLKRHPRSTGTPLPPGFESCVEIPHRLPAEVLAPFLDDVEIVGSLTSALITLVRLGHHVRARSLPSTAPIHPRVSTVYGAAGIGPLQPPDLHYLL